MINMVKLNTWTDINKSLFRRHIPEVISARELLVFREFEKIFSNQRKDAEAHQSFCGQLFLVTKARLEDVQKDFLHNPICPKCAQSSEDKQDYEWRRKFERFRKLTEAIQALERSPVESRMEAEKRVRDLTRDLFEFKDLRELYIKYFEMMNELGAKQDYTSGLSQIYRQVIDELFKKGKEENLVQFIKLVFSLDRNEISQIGDAIWETELSVIREEKDYFLEKVADYPILVKPTTEEDLARNRTIAQLFLYCHLTEMNALYDFSLNLVFVASGKRYQKDPFPNSAKYPQNKIEIIDKSERHLGEIFKQFYCREIRNAFVHSKYKFEENHFVKTDENFKIELSALQDKINLLNSFWKYVNFKIAQEQVTAIKTGEMKTKHGDLLKIDVN